MNGCCWLLKLLAPTLATLAVTPFIGQLVLCAPSSLIPEDVLAFLAFHTMPFDCKGGWLLSTSFSRSPGKKPEPWSITHDTACTRVPTDSGHWPLTGGCLFTSSASFLGCQVVDDKGKKSRHGGCSSTVLSQLSKRDCGRPARTLPGQPHRSPFGFPFSPQFCQRHGQGL